MWAKNEEIVSLLLQAGANTDLQNKVNRQPTQKQLAWNQAIILQLITHQIFACKHMRFYTNFASIKGSNESKAACTTIML